VRFAQEIVARFHDVTAAALALTDFESRFRQGGMPETMAEHTLSAGTAGLAIANILKQTGLTASTSEALRMIEQGGVKLDGEKIADKSLILNAGKQMVLQVGKRKFARVLLE
jgi:tyrosyl-tRNA synthetase